MKDTRFPGPIGYLVPSRAELLNAFYAKKLFSKAAVEKKDMLRRSRVVLTEQNEILRACKKTLEKENLILRDSNAALEIANETLTLSRVALKMANESLKDSNTDLKSVFNILRVPEAIGEMLNESLIASKIAILRANETLKDYKDDVKAANEGLKDHKDDLKIANEILKASKAALETENETLRASKMAVEETNWALESEKNILLASKIAVEKENATLRAILNPILETAKATLPLNLDITHMDIRNTSIPFFDWADPYTWDRFVTEFDGIEAFDDTDDPLYVSSTSDLTKLSYVKAQLLKVISYIIYGSTTFTVLKHSHHSSCIYDARGIAKILKGKRIDLETYDGKTYSFKDLISMCKKSINRFDMTLKPR